MTDRLMLETLKLDHPSNFRRLHEAMQTHPDLADLRNELTEAVFAVPYNRKRHADAHRRFFERASELEINFGWKTPTPGQV